MNRTAWILIGIIICGALLRLPGVFWGYYNATDDYHVYYNPDEYSRVEYSVQYLTGKVVQLRHYPQAFSVQIALLAKLWLFNDQYSQYSSLILVGRFLSLIYGVLFILLIYYLSKYLFRLERPALLCALWTAFCPVLVTQSHVSNTDMANTFWLYTAFLFSFMYIRDKNFYQLLAVILSVAMCLALKLTFIGLWIPVYVGFRTKKPVGYYVFLTVVLFILFQLFNGGYYGWTDFQYTKYLVDEGLFRAAGKHNDLGNIPVYIFTILICLSLPVFIWMLNGIKSFLLSIKFNGIRQHLDLIGICGVPLAVHFYVMHLFDTPYERFVLPLIPLCIVAGCYGFEKFMEGKSIVWQKSAFLLTGLYLLASIISTEFYFVKDTRELAEVWLRNNIPEKSVITMPRYSNIDGAYEKYVVEKEYKGEYLVLHEAYYHRYIRSRITPYVRFPQDSYTYKSKPVDHQIIQNIFQGKSQYQLVKAFRVYPIVPEKYLFKEIWGTFTTFQGDTLIYRKKSG